MPSAGSLIHIDMAASVEAVRIVAFESAANIEAVAVEDVDKKAALFVDTKEEVFVVAFAQVEVDHHELLMEDIVEVNKLHHQLVRRIIQLCT